MKLLEAAGTGNNESVIQLISDGAEITSRNRFGDTGLHFMSVLYLSAFHLVLPFLFSFIVWQLLMIGKECSRGAPSNIPLPPITKRGRFLCD